MANKRNFEDRHHKKIETNQLILISFEGETESNYFNNFKGHNKKYRIQYSYGNQTDPINLVKNLVNTINKYIDFDSNKDKAYCVFDVDTYNNKEKQINEAIELCKEYNIIPITSAPCIELWYLLHFEDCNSYINTKDVLKRLNKHISNYKKGMDIGEKLKPLVNDAINRAKMLEKMNDRNEHSIGSINANPNTEIYKIIEYLMNLEENK